MIFIGEKINGTRKSIQKAIIERDNAFIEGVAKEQAEAGADYLDINAGTSPDREEEDMLWLIDTVQAATDIPLCIDSSSARVISSAIGKVSKMPIINSINADPKRLDAFLPIIKEKKCPVIALALDESKSDMPKTLRERKININRIFDACQKYGILFENIYVDPLIMTVATDITAGMEVFETIGWIKREYPEAHITGGLSNISYGLPSRSIINRTFLTLAVFHGMDSAILDPANTEIIEAVKATYVLLGKDKFCRNYTKASKAGFSRK